MGVWLCARTFVVKICESWVKSFKKFSVYHAMNRRLHPWWVMTVLYCKRNVNKVDNSSVIKRSRVVVRKSCVRWMHWKANQRISSVILKSLECVFVILSGVQRMRHRKSVSNFVFSISIKSVNRINNQRSLKEFLLCLLPVIFAKEWSWPDCSVIVPCLAKLIF